MLDVTIQFLRADQCDDHRLREVDHRTDRHRQGLFPSVAGTGSGALRGRQAPMMKRQGHGFMLLPQSR